MVQYEEKYWIQIVPYILKSINSVEKKLKAVLDLMNVAQVPWSKTLSDIFIDCLNYSHPLVSEIKSKIENYPSRSILQKYGFLQPHGTEVSKQASKDIGFFKTVSIFSYHFGWKGLFMKRGPPCLKI